MSDFDSILKLVDDYFAGLYAGDVGQLRAVFHPRARLHMATNGSLMELEFEPYMDVVGSRASPRSQNAQRDDRLLAIHQTTADTALVIVSLLLGEKSYTDHLSLIKLTEGWKIISKVYHLNNPDASAMPMTR